MSNWLREVEFTTENSGIRVNWQNYYTFQEHLGSVEETKLGAVYHLQSYLLQKGVLTESVSLAELERALREMDEPDAG